MAPSAKSSVIDEMWDSVREDLEEIEQTILPHVFDDKFVAVVVQLTAPDHIRKVLRKGILEATFVEVSYSDGVISLYDFESQTYRIFIEELRRYVVRSIASIMYRYGEGNNTLIGSVLIDRARNYLGTASWDTEWINYADDPYGGIRNPINDVFRYLNTMNDQTFVDLQDEIARITTQNDGSEGCDSLYRVE